MQTAKRRRIEAAIPGRPHPHIRPPDKKNADCQPRQHLQQAESPLARHLLTPAQRMPATICLELLIGSISL